MMGFAVVKCDNRGTSRRGSAFESAIWKQMGGVEIQDQCAAVDYLVKTMRVADPHNASFIYCIPLTLSY